MKYLALIIILVFSTTKSFAQNKGLTKHKPFSLLIISPDSISLDESLKQYVDTVESSFRQFYYAFIEQMEINKKYESEEDQKDTELKIERAKLAEMDVLNTRYYQFISMLTCAELWYLFDAEHDEDLSFNFTTKQNLFSYDLKAVANYYDEDYILTYKQITTPIENGEPVLKIEMELHAKNSSKIIYRDVAFGHSRFYKDNSGTLRACPNDLECMVESGVIACAAELYTFIKRRQEK